MILKRGNIVSSLSFRDKLLSLDFVLVFSILLLGIISMFAMYSTDGGKMDYHTRSHIIRFSVFFIMFITISFFQSRFWYETSTYIYFCFHTSSGSKILWINLFRITKMVKFLFYELTTFRINENRINFISS